MLPKPDWDSGNVSMSPLPPDAPPEWHTMSHNLGSMNLLVDARVGGTNAQGQAVWILSDLRFSRSLIARPWRSAGLFIKKTGISTNRSWRSQNLRSCGCGSGVGEISATKTLFAQVPRSSVFLETRTDPPQHLRAYRAQIGFLRILSDHS
jgi:hypothetical protein